MKLLLHSDIPKLGYFGDVVEVKDGFARNYLLPQRLAVLPTAGNLKAIEEQKAKKAEERRLARTQMEKAAAKVNEQSLTMIVKTNEQGHLFGSITDEMVAATLQEKGYEVATRHVVLHEHIREVGDFQIKLRFAEDIHATISLHVRPEGASDESQTEGGSGAE